jgi:UDP-N-acetylmuramyl pentapeptide phosphotransferase/UDP-N-acetylglucosamine-1-phosphate transferase
VVGAAGTRAYLVALAARPPGGAARWEYRNYAGRSVSRLGGPAYALAVLTTTAIAPGARRPCIATAAAVGVAAAVGAYDDLGGDPSHRGLAGHGAELLAGRLTSGAVKVLGLSAGGLAAGALLRRNLREAVLSGALVAGCANLANLLDVRPGRAIKAGLLAGLPALSGPAGIPAAAGLGAAAALLPDDLGERLMLGDTGAGALGAAVGVGLAAGASPTRLRRLLTVVAGLVVASELVSFSRVIDAIPALRFVDRLGRRA